MEISVTTQNKVHATRASRLHGGHIRLAFVGCNLAIWAGIILAIRAIV
jgi:hypothetical protein